MTTNTDAVADAIRLALGIRTSQAEADCAACVIEDLKGLKLPEQVMITNPNAGRKHLPTS